MSVGLLLWVIFLLAMVLCYMFDKSPANDILDERSHIPPKRPPRD